MIENGIRTNMDEIMKIVKRERETRESLVEQKWRVRWGRGRI